jgi:hypothetical protein
VSFAQATFVSAGGQCEGSVAGLAIPCDAPNSMSAGPGITANLGPNGLSPESAAVDPVGVHYESPPCARVNTGRGRALPLALGARDSFPATHRSIHVEVP